MDCRHVDRLLEANLEGRLSGFERMGLRQHLKTCRGCRAKVEAMTAFSASIEKTLACADAPDWRRLAPPAPVAAALPSEPTAPPPRPPQRRPPSPTARRRRGWPTFGVAVVGVALVAAVAPFWTASRPTSASPTWLTAAIAVEATRQAAGSGLDLVTSDPEDAIAWFAARGLPELPALALPAGVKIEGAFLTWYDDARVAGIALTSPAGRLTLHLRPAAGGRAGAPTVASADGLAAVGTTAGAWRTAVIGDAGVVDPAALERWLPTRFIAAAAGV